MIKFRAWDKVQNKMLLPDNIEFIHGQAYWAEASTDGNGSYSNDGRVDGIGALFELEQFTGLTDVSGKEIYEGDILENRKYRSIVKFASGKFLADLIETIQTFDLIGETHGSKVIGNVHENAELLKG
ncbi:YopX family protein [Lactiplantibacillus plantarum]|uniref:YopX family protein n=1 Tax=Lactiplantibacillus plantarum TaxID=1590 RepID=UPI002D784EBA|nr:YopX family protein [Lactiplantibacillus plantarum]